MSNVSAWSVTAGLNNSSPPDGWPEGMARSAVNDAAREIQAALARWYAVSDGSLQTTGTGDAYVLTTPNSFTSFADLPLLAFRLDRANTGPITLNVDGLGAKIVYRSAGQVFDFHAAGELEGDQTMVVVHSTDGAIDWFEQIGPNNAGIQATTRMIFNQTAAPDGWLKESSATYNNKALRLTTGTAGTGGSTAFTSVFAARTVALANLPVTNLSLGLLTGSVATGISNGTNVVHSSASYTAIDGAGANHSAVPLNTTPATVSLADGTVNFGGSIPLGGSATAMDFAVAYVDMIIATKL